MTVTTHKAFKPSQAAILLLALLALLLSWSTRSADAEVQFAQQSAQAALKTVTLKAQADVHVDSLDPGANHASDPLSVVPTSIGLVEFDLSALPAGATIEEATLRLMPSDIIGTDPITVAVGRAGSDWNETLVTWNNRPAITTGGPSAVVADYVWIEWTVTAMVQQWHGGSQTNHGFGLRTADNGVVFHSKETGPAPELRITYSHPDDLDDPQNPAQDRPDLGDAPDSSNHHGIVNTAYAGTAGNYPTVWQDPAGGPSGPKHANATVEAFLGDFITREEEADLGPDADGPNNVLRHATTGATGDFADRDRADDGWRNRNVPILDCQRTTLVVRVHKTAAATQEEMFLNVWFDGTRDGDWMDTGICEFEDGQQARAYEWIVQDHVVDLSGIPAGGHRDIPVTTVLVHNPSPQATHWMRFTLSEVSAPRGETDLADGRGRLHPAVYAYGESEDILQKPDPQGALGEVVVTKLVETPSTPVPYGDTVTYKIQVEHRGGTAPLPVILNDVVDYPKHLMGPVSVSEISGTVRPLFARVEYRRARRAVDTSVRWRGTLSPNAAMEISFDVHIHPYCRADETTKTITNQVQVRLPGDVNLHQDSVMSVDFQALCSGVDLGDIEVAQELVTFEEDSPARAAAAPDLLLPAVQAVRSTPIRATFTNNADQPVTLGVFPTVEIHLASPDRTGDASSALTVEPSSLTVPPGESRTVEYQADLARLVGDAGNDIPEVADEAFTVHSTIQYAVMPGDLPLVALEDLDAGLVAENNFDFHYRPWDFGDAGDSTNHAGAAMTAYPDGTQAHFPTVFDPATGAEQGPAHARPRPFHLGRQVSAEVEADTGPDSDGPNNIVPPADNADRDGFDDGLSLANVQFQHCQLASFPVRVFIHPVAKQRLLELGLENVYINVWIDGLGDDGVPGHDGDWNDAATCADDQTALEHIVIDQAVSVNSLNPGLNVVNVATTGPVPWPQEEPAWLRITLSERESNKTLETNGIKHGDGRGYSGPFRSGETEDYLLRHASAGPDLSIEGDVTWEPVMPTDEPDARRLASLNFEEIKVTYRLRLHNEGGAAATGTQIELDQALPDGAQVQGYVVNPELQKWIELDAGDNVFDFDTLQSGDAAVLMVSYVTGFDGKGNDVAGASINAADSLVVDFNVVASSNETDADPDDNETTLNQTIEPPVTVHGFAVEKVERYRRQGTTSSTSIQLQGSAPPESTVHVLGSNFTEGFVTAQSDENGVWSLSIDGLQEGVHRIHACLPAGQTDCPGSARMARSMPHAASVVVNVRPDLPFDPATFSLTDSKGRTFQPDITGFFGTETFTYLMAGETYEISVHASQGYANVSMDLNIIGILIAMKDDDGDGRFTGEFTYEGSNTRSTATESLVALTVVADGVESSYTTTVEEATSGVVRDLSTGQPIDGATVSLLEGAEVSGEAADLIYPQWAGALYGQPNPQVTGADGQYLFSPPTGTYRVLVQKNGYQSYRTEAIAVADGEVVNPVVSLTPVTGEAGVQVSIAEGGFSPAVFEVEAGAVIEFVNTDVAPHSVTGNGWDSGLLLNGERYRITAGSEGSFSVSDGTDPANSATISVDVQAGQTQLFLPVLQR